MGKNYSDRTLVQKLGIKSEQKMLVINAPKGYQKLLVSLPDRTTQKEVSFEQLGQINNQFDFIQLFVQSQERLKEVFPIAKIFLKKSGTIWLCWPKGHCDIRSDLNENIVREIGLLYGLVDIKIISVDNTWSSLKFVYRLIDRS